MVVVGGVIRLHYSGNGWLREIGKRIQFFILYYFYFILLCSYIILMS